MVLQYSGLYHSNQLLSPNTSSLQILWTLWAERNPPHNPDYFECISFYLVDLRYWQEGTI